MLCAPINHADLNRIEGKYPLLPQSLPARCGSEGVARVVGVGPSVSLKPGDRVLPKGFGLGTWSQRLVCSEEQLLPVPYDDLDDKDAAQLSVNPAAAIRMLEDFQHIRPGEHAIVQNCANSAVGRSVIQLCESRGIPTINFIRDRNGSDQVSESLRELGASEVLRFGEEKSEVVSSRLKQYPTVPLGLVAAGGESSRTVGKLISRNGSMVVYGATDKNAIAVNASQLLFNNVSVHGFWLSEWYNNADEQRRQALYAQVADEIRDGMVLPAHSFPLEALHEALRAAMSPRQGRKVLFSCR